MKQPNQDGFSPAGILLLLGCLLLAAGIGTYIYARNHGGALPFTSVKSTPAVYTGSNENSTSPGGIPGGATQNPTPNGVASGMTTVKIPDAGFSITVPDSMKDLTYHAAKGSGGLVTVTFSTASLTAAEPRCAANQGHGAFNTVIRGSGQYPGPGAGASGGLIKQHNGYYFAYVLPSGPCAQGMSLAAQKLADTQSQDFYTALSSVAPL